MHTEYHKEFSPVLNKDMEYKVYGHAGKPCIVFPCQNGRFYDYADFGMVDILAPYINQGRLRLICVDSLDGESWSANAISPRQRSENQEKYYHYIVDEIVPRIWEISDGRRDLLVTGCSMGGFHATNFFFRRPDLFDSLICLSGCLDATHFFGDYMDELVYNNSPVHFLQNMPPEHYYWDMYKQRAVHICIGQGAWEDDLLPSNKTMAKILAQHGLYCVVDFWGHDVNHDWPWWKKQILYFLNKVIGSI